MKGEGSLFRRPFFRMILDSPETYRNFRLRDGYMRLTTKDMTAICVPSVMIEGRAARERLISQAHSVLAHLGATKTLTYPREHV